MKRSERLDRVVLFLLGVAITGAAVAGLARAVGALGAGEAARPLITSAMTDGVREQDGRLWFAVAALALVLAVLGVAWLLHQFRRVHSPAQVDLPNLELGRLDVPASVVADAVHADLLRHPAITDAAVHVLDADPARVDIVIDVHERVDLPELKLHLRSVLDHLQTSVGAVAREGRCTIRLVPSARVAA